MCSSSPFILQFLNDKAFEHIVYHRKEKNTKMQAKGQQKRKMILPFAFQWLIRTFRRVQVCFIYTFLSFFFVLNKNPQELECRRTKFTFKVMVPVGQVYIHNAEFVVFFFSCIVKTKTIFSFISTFKVIEKKIKCCTTLTLYPGVVKGESSPFYFCVFFFIFFCLSHVIKSRKCVRSFSC